MLPLLMRGRMRTFLLCPVVVAIICLTALGMGIYPAAAADDSKGSKIALPDDLALIPNDAAAFLCLQVGKHWNGPEAESLKKIAQAHPLVLTSWSEDIEKEIGLSISEIERFVLVIPDFKAKGNIAAWILTTSKPFNRDKVLSMVVPEPKQTMIGSKKYFVSDKSPNGVQIVNGRTLIEGSAVGLRAFLSRPHGAKGGPLQQAVASAAENHFLIAGFVPAVFLPVIKNSGDQGKAFAPLFEAKSWRITADVAKELRINLRFDYADEAAAKEGQKALQELTKPLIDFTFVAEKGMDDFFKREAEKYKGIKELSSRYPTLFENTRAALKDLQVDQKGANVQGTLRIKTNEPATSFVLLLSLVPRPAKK